ncbi:MAG: hypothetical protein ACC645_11760 [Pirellulales bacterium]
MSVIIRRRWLRSAGFFLVVLVFAACRSAVAAEGESKLNVIVYAVWWFRLRFWSWAA